jgi:hypothetical protein
MRLEDILLVCHRIFGHYAHLIEADHTPSAPYHPIPRGMRANQQPQSHCRPCNSRNLRRSTILSMLKWLF